MNCRRYACAVTAHALVLAAILMVAVSRDICHDNSYVMSGQFCYRYVQSLADYSAANRTCTRDGGSSALLYIDSVEEDSYVWSSIYIEEGGQDFWLGLDDQNKDGTFRWLITSQAPSYTNYTSNFESLNTPQYNCVKFSANGWTIVQDFCGNAKLPFVCKAPICSSSDGEVCDSVSSESGSGGGLGVGVIVAIVIILIIFVVVIVVVILLFLLWKYRNDTFRRYLLCCVSGTSQQAMMSLQQENQRLRQELSHKKISTSGRYPKGSFMRDSISGVPDGQGGMLPAIKQNVGGAGGRSLSPITPFSRSTSSQPPPLSLQRASSQIAPMSQTTPSLRPTLSSTPSTFTSRTPTTLGALAQLRQQQSQKGPSLSPVVEQEKDEDEVEEIILPSEGDKVPPLDSEEVKPTTDHRREGAGGVREEGRGGGAGSEEDKGAKVKSEESNSEHSSDS